MKYASYFTPNLTEMQLDTRKAQNCANCPESAVSYMESCEIKLFWKLKLIYLATITSDVLHTQLQ